MFNPWDAIVTPDALVDMRDADDWWALILGTGFRGTLDALAPDGRATVERRVRAAMADAPPVRIPIVLATAGKPS